MKKIRFTWINLITVIISITVLLSIISGCHKNKAQTVYNILVIHSFDSLYTWGEDIKKGIDEGFATHHLQVKIRHFYLNCEMLNSQQELDTLYHLLDEYMYAPPHLILVEDDQATFSLITSNHPITHTVPIIFSGVSYLNYDIIAGYNNITGFECKRDFLTCYELAKKIVPKITRINVLTDSTILGQASQKEFLTQWQNVSDNEKEKVDIRFIPYREMKTFRVLYPFYSASKGDIFILPKWDFTISQFSNISAQPFFTISNEGIGKNINGGILGGIFTLPRQQGIDGADLASRILKGEKTITNVPLQYHATRPIFDWAQIKRLKIEKSTLPENSYIYNIPTYEKYKTEIIVITISVFVLLFFLIFLYLLEKNKKKRIQSRLRNKQNLLSQVLRIGNFYMWSYDLTTQKFTFDKRFFQDMGLPEDDSYKRGRITLIKKIHPDDRRNFYNTIMGAIRDRSPKVVCQFRMSLKPDEYEWWETQFSLSPHISSSNAQIYGLCFSIEHIKQREMDLIIARDLAAKAELKQSFVANISHEIRTPLNAIIGFANLLTDEHAFEPEERQSFIQTINRNCDILLKLIDNVLELSKLESDSIPLVLESCNMEQIMDTVYSQHIMRIPESIHFTLETPHKQIIIKSDSIRLTQLLSNMLDNAIKFTKEGNITIGYCIDHSQYLTLFVKDTGIGIPEEERELIFDRFYKCNEFTQGPGLGLSICAAIAQLLDASINVESEIGKGSCFSVHIPIHESDQIPIDEDKEIESDYLQNISPSKKKENSQDNNREHTVIIAEDIESNFLLLKTIIGNRCRILWAKNGNEAIELYKNNTVDLILMDIKMPEMGGIEALKEIRKLSSDIPIIMQTAYAFDSDKDIAMEAGCTGFITKPINPIIVKQIISNYISGIIW
ncbi:ATP-binding protein [Coprobacter sp.]